MKINKNSNYINTTVGILSKDDLDSWIVYYDKYAKGTSLRKIGIELGVGHVFLSNLFFKRLGLPKVANLGGNVREMINTNKGYLNKYKIEDWIVYYDKYTQGTFIGDLSKELGIGSDTISNILFNILCLEKVDNTSARMNKIKTSNILKYGVDNVFKLKTTVDKIKHTKFTKYSDENYCNVSKISSTKIDKYGDASYNNRDKARETCLARYGVVNYNISEEGRDRLRKATTDFHIDRILDNIKSANLELMENYKGIRDNRNKSIDYRFKCLECGTEFTKMLEYLPRCPHCKPKRILHKQNSINDFINNLGFSTELNHKLVCGKEVDIFIPNLNIGFEYNGSYWHSNLFKERNYHKDKSEEASKEGILLYHIWEYFEESVVESKIRSILGKTCHKLKGKKLFLKQLTPKEQNIFLSENHLHGYCKSTFSLGLFENDLLVSLISFIVKKDGTSELVRFCNKKNYIVYQAFNVLLRHGIKVFRDKYPEIKKIVTFAYRDWTPDSKSNIYITNKFQLVGINPPSMYYFDNKSKKVYNRQKFMKYKLKNLFPNDYSDNLTELEILKINNIHPIYDSGTFKYEINI